MITFRVYNMRTESSIGICITSFTSPTSTERDFLENPLPPTSLGMLFFFVRLLELFFQVQTNRIKQT